LGDLYEFVKKVWGDLRRKPVGTIFTVLVLIVLLLGYFLLEGYFSETGSQFAREKETNEVHDEVESDSAFTPQSASDTSTEGPSNEGQAKVGDAISVLFWDMVLGAVELSLHSEVEPDLAAYMHVRAGTREDAERLLHPIVASATKKVFGAISYTEALRSQSRLEKQLLDSLRSAYKEYGLSLTSVIITRILKVPQNGTYRSDSSFADLDEEFPINRTVSKTEAIDVFQGEVVFKLISAWGYGGDAKIQVQVLDQKQEILEFREIGDKQTFIYHGRTMIVTVMRVSDYSATIAIVPK